MMGWIMEGRKIGYYAVKIEAATKKTHSNENTKYSSYPSLNTIADSDGSDHEPSIEIRGQENQHYRIFSVYRPPFSINAPLFFEQRPWRWGSLIEGYESGCKSGLLGLKSGLSSLKSCISDHSTSLSDLKSRPLGFSGNKSALFYLKSVLICPSGLESALSGLSAHSGLLLSLCLQILLRPQITDGQVGQINQSPPLSPFAPLCPSLSSLGPLLYFPLLEFKIMQRRATGIADHMTWNLPGKNETLHPTFASIMD